MPGLSRLSEAYAGSRVRLSLHYNHTPLYPFPTDYLYYTSCLFIHSIYPLVTVWSVSILFHFYSYIYLTLHTEHPQSLPLYPTEGEFSLYHCSFIHYLFITVDIIYNRFVLIIESLPLYPTEDIIYNTVM